MMIFFGVLGLALLAVAGYVLRGVYYIRKAKRLTAEVEAIGARVAGRSVDQGFLPGDRLDTEHSGPVPAEHGVVLAAVRSGDWQAGAAWVEAAGRNWEERYTRVYVLGEEAAEDDGWLRAWRAARPADPTAAAIDADSALTVASNVRGALRANQTSREQFRVFHELQRKAQVLVEEAQALADPADPTPYILEQPVALGLGYSNERYRALSAEIVKRDPKNLSAHVRSLQYWCAKWHGSHEEAMAYAREAAALGGPGDLLTLLPLYAYFEQETHEDDLDPDVYFKEPEVVAAATAALADLAAAAPDDRRALRLRHMLAWFLYWQDRYPEAIEQFRHVDGYIGTAPWTYSGDPAARYLKARDYSVGQVTPGA
ncbi:hypothetical protein ACFWAR_33145 [Streptomyces sp. NPDC059917]|uniref:hypothetical protein n=1 Tax=Streptomyces sp. NPDC059917 TaxID=3347002 RepID=UPI00364F4D9D